MSTGRIMGIILLVGGILVLVSPGILQLDPVWEKEIINLLYTIGVVVGITGVILLIFGKKKNVHQ
jgi:uncharacterized membrane protein